MQESEASLDLVAIMSLSSDCMIDDGTVICMYFMPGGCDAAGPGSPVRDTMCIASR